MTSLLPRYAVFQLLTLLLVCAVYQSMFYQKATMLLFCVVFSHYILAIYYSRHYIADIFRLPENYLPFAVLLIGGTGLYLIGVSALYVFALHHALNESYIRLRYQSKSLPEKRLNLIQPVGFFLHLSAYMVLARVQLLEKSPAEFWFYLSLVGILMVLYFGLILRAKAHFTASQLITVLFAELALVPLLLVDHFLYDFNYMQIIFYHVVFWVFFPGGNILSSGKKGAFSWYVLLTVVSIGAFVVTSPLYTKDWSHFITYREQFVIWSYFHIFSSFAFSKANPAWINKQFKVKEQKSAKLQA